MQKKWIDKNEKLGLRLTLAERKLILEDPIHIHDEIADPIRATTTGDPVLLTLDKLEDLGGHVAAEANHSTDKKLRKMLDAILSKIQDLLETHTDEEPPKSLKIEDAQRGKATRKAVCPTRRTGSEAPDRCRAAWHQDQAGRSIPVAGGGTSGAADDPCH